MGRRAVRLGVTGFLIMLTAACSAGAWSGPSLRPAGKLNPSTGGLPAVSASHHALVGGMLLCLTGPGQAVITAVKPIHPIGTIEVLDYATRPNPLLEGGELLDQGYGSLRTNGFTANRIVDTPCGASDSGQGDELALELSVPHGTNAGTTGWQIDYRIGDHAASTTFPLGAVLCSTSSMDDKTCKRVWQQYGLPW